MLVVTFSNFIFYIVILLSKEFTDKFNLLLVTFKKNYITICTSTWLMYNQGYNKTIIYNSKSNYVVKIVRYILCFENSSVN